MIVYKIKALENQCLFSSPKKTNDTLCDKTPNEYPVIDVCKHSLKNETLVGICKCRCSAGKLDDKAGRVAASRTY